MFKYNIRVHEWNLSNFQFLNESIIEKRIESRPREEDYEVLYLDNSTRLFSTNRGIYRIKSPSQIQIIKDLPNEGMDICADGTMAVFAQNGRIGLLLDVQDTGPSNIRWGPTLNVKEFQVAISSDKKYISATTPYQVIVYSTEDFSVVRSFSGVNIIPKHTSFRPNFL